MVGVECQALKVELFVHDGKADKTLSVQAQLGYKFTNNPGIHATFLESGSKYYSV